MNAHNPADKGTETNVLVRWLNWLGRFNTFAIRIVPKQFCE